MTYEISRIRFLNFGLQFVVSKFQASILCGTVLEGCKHFNGVSFTIDGEGRRGEQGAGGARGFKYSKGVILV